MTPHVPVRLLVGLAVMAAIVAAAWRWHDAAFVTPAYWMDVVAAHPASAPAIFAAGYALAVVLFLPTLPLNLVAGALWGPVLGSGIAVTGSAAGAIAAFLLARFAVVLPRGGWGDGGRVAWLQARLAEHGWKVVAFVRLNPIFPGPVNFLFGLTSIPTRTYCWATAIFLIPPTVAFAVIGHSVGAVALDGQAENLRRVLLVAGASVLFLVLSAVALRRYTARSEPVR